MKFNCPKCSQSIEVDESYAGQTGNCPSCNELVVIPPPISPVLQPAVATISDSATVTITTKNTTALTMGIIAIVLGVIGLLVSWIPFLGLIAIPIAGIGGLLAIIGLVLAAMKKFKGWSMPLLGGLVCLMALLISFCSTGSTTAIIGEGIKEVSKASENRSNAQKIEKADTEAESKDYIANNLDLYDVEAKYFDSVLNGKVPGVLFKLKNKGDRTLDRVEVKCFFLDGNGNRISEEDFHPVSVSGYSFGGDNKPLKPGYVWSMEAGKFYTAKSVPSEWKEGSIEVEISEIKFAAGDKK
jgi:hypothetical protein